MRIIFFKRFIELYLYIQINYLNYKTLNWMKKKKKGKGKSRMAKL